MNDKLKRLASLLLCFSMLLLAACGGKQAEESDGDILPDQSGPAAEGEAAAPETPENSEKEQDSAESAPAEQEQGAKPTAPVVEEPTAAASYEEIYQALTAVQDAVSGIYELNEQDPMQEEQKFHPEAELFGDPDYAMAEPPLPGVQTGSLSVTDGERIYMVSTGELVIVDAAGAETAELGRAFVANPAPEGFSGSEIPQAVYVDGTRVYVVTYEYLYRNNVPGSEMAYDSAERVHVKCYDVSDPQNPLILSDYAQSGRYLNSYLANGVLYLIGAYSVWMPEEADPATFVPTVTQNGEDALMAAGDIWICPGLDSTDYTVVSAFETATGECLRSMALTGYHAWSEADGEGLYLARTSYRFDVSESYTEAQYTVCDYAYNAYTRLVRLAMDGSLDVTDHGVVEGYLYGDGAMTLSGGTLYLGTACSGFACRIYTDEAYGFVNYVPGEKTASTAVYALDSGLQVTGVLEDVAPGTDVYSIRFDGRKAYVIGYEDLTPLVVADLAAASPAAAPVSAELPYTHHLFAFGEGMTAGIGVDGESGMLRLCIYEDALTETASAEVTGDWQTAMYTPGSVQVFADLQMIAVPSGSDAYAVYGYADGQLTQLGTAEMGYVSADTRAFCLDDIWYFCNDATVIALNSDFEPLAKTEFAYG